MGKNEVLADGLADETRVVGITGEIRRHLLPEGLKYFGRTREVNAAEVTIADEPFADERRRSGDEVHDPGRETGLLQDAKDDVVRVDGGRRGLPHHRAAHDRRGSGQIASDGREIERRDSVDEAFEPAIVHRVPDAG